MNVFLENSAKTQRAPLPLLVALHEKGKLLGKLLPSEEARFGAALKAYLAKAENSNGEPLPGESFPHPDQTLLALPLPSKKGLPRRDLFRLAAARILDSAKARKSKTVTVAVEKIAPQEVSALAEGFGLSGYEFLAYKSGTAAKGEPPPAIGLRTAEKQHSAAALHEAAVFARFANLCRDWVNTPGSDLDPETFAGKAKALAKSQGLKITVRDEKRLAKEGFQGLVTVGKGSDRPPRLVTLQYDGSKSTHTPHLALVGKGVTFDTGGISLKPSGGMWEMKSDMAGAATVLAAVSAIAELKLKVKVTAILCLAENRPGNASVLPGDVFRAKNGKTVMVDNTDAEGRLVLSDGLWEAGACGATHIVDLATLTGSVIRALGPSIAGLFANEDKFAETILRCAEASDEKFCRLPLEAEYRDWLDDPVADMKNAGKAEAGAITAALFLQEFLPPGVTWSHWDIAGTAFITAPWKHYRSGGTAWGLRTLIALAARMSKG